MQELEINIDIQYHGNFGQISSVTKREFTGDESEMIVQFIAGMIKLPVEEGHDVNDFEPITNCVSEVLGVSIDPSAIKSAQVRFPFFTNDACLDIVLKNSNSVILTMHKQLFF